MAAEDATVIEVDQSMARTLELRGLLCFHCPLLEDPRFSYRDRTTGECRVRYRDLEPVLAGPRSGIRAVIITGQIAAYAVFGPPDAFRNVEALPFAVDGSALLVAALYVIPQARADNLDVDLLMAVMDFARARDFPAVQVVCRRAAGDEPEGRAEMLEAAGFEVSEPIDGLCLAGMTVAAWDESQADTG